MKRLGLVLAMITVAIFAGSQAQARDEKDTRFCGGQKDGMYYNVAGEVGNRLAGAGYKVHRVITQGSVQNLKMMMQDHDPCDVAIAQNDALRNFMAKNGDARQKIQRNAPLYQEAVHFLCNKQFAEKHSVSRVPDIRKFDPAKSKVQFAIAIGSPGSGVNETWLSISDADKDYSKIATTTDSGLLAVEKIVDGNDVQCMLYTAALNTSFMQTVNADYKGKVVLLGFDDSDLDNAKDQTGKPIYSISAIPSGTYRNIQPSGMGCFGSCEVKTAFVGANLVYSREWAERSGGLTDLIKAKNAAMPTINSFISGKK